uniref:Uncharacterized protein n=1 Tax=Timema tahoe TaxID=61484 RepID=A0A7R9IIL7_9NEOP|nr:unnamed protein product [Timema tahoe]
MTKWFLPTILCVTLLVQSGSAINCFVCNELFHDYCGEVYSGPTGPEALKRCGPSFPPLLACLTFRTPGGMITRGCGIRGYCDNAVEGTYCDVCFKDGCNGSFKI